MRCLPERSVAADRAITAARNAIISEGLQVHLSRPRTGPHQQFADASCHLLRGSQVVSRSRGKGYGDQAIASALFESIEHAVAEGAAFRDPGTTVTHVVARLAFNPLIARRDALVALAARQAGEIIPCVAFRSINRLIDAEMSEHLPAVMVELPAELPDTGPLRTIGRYASSNGIAAGMTLEDATLHALNEVLERDALSVLMLAHGRERRVGTLLDTRNDPGLHRVVSAVSARVEGPIELLEVPALAGRCVVAYTARCNMYGMRLIGSGASVMLSYAAERAVLELQQNIVAEEEPVSETEDGDSLSRGLLVSFPVLRRAASLADVRPAGRALVQPSPRLPVGLCLRILLDRLASRGHPVLRRVLWTAARGDPCPQVVQVVVPGAERLHLARAGLPVECTGRLRTEDALRAIRSRRPLRRWWCAAV
jgi:ribosomal protein S12 methylthiotransferase accessory factor